MSQCLWSRSGCSCAHVYNGTTLSLRVSWPRGFWNILSFLPSYSLTRGVISVSKLVRSPILLSGISTPPPSQSEWVSPRTGHAVGLVWKFGTGESGGWGWVYLLQECISRGSFLQVQDPKGLVGTDLVSILQWERHLLTLFPKYGMCSRKGWQADTFHSLWPLDFLTSYKP